MNQKTFDKSVAAQLAICEDVLLSKGSEYALDSDRLSHFKRSASLMGCSVKQAIFNMLAKHIISISDMVASDQKFSRERWSEKITDAINYLIILRATVMEELHEED